ncbi:MAG: carboxymuconolactone decarboxylase family protein [Bacteroidota bacterium]|nr:carboxymuconolactone decarboxylase family protein [Bacteroidota bacterium]MDP4216520.1 carboxymuconolactone decarboxylase family protein [Bacteroidota bacterium]MDP4247056.1 carboxymuconolactone decarboxylase family protein [Bacteroidota bacterium]MDP4254029.1 carboxymuconolactone decarboxylase family protein [Bacteroidota bacterium]MDP4257441.1 carboxymuconolactone decarboxylase family protein [Bacteroidota bacterium]
MARLKVLDPALSSGKAKELFTAIESKFGSVPNTFKIMGNSPALLEGSLRLSAALSTGKLGSKTSELIALAVAESNSCSYCLSAHTYVATNLMKMDTATLEAARHGRATDPKTDAILKFSTALVTKRGMVDDADLYALRDAGVTEEEAAEIVGHVAINMLTNYFNNTAMPEIDFPLVMPNPAATV